MSTQYACEVRGRVEALRNAGGASPSPHLNGIEYLEVGPNHSTLEVHFVHDLAFAPAAPLQAANVEIRGGERVRDPKVTHVQASGKVLTVDVVTPGDFSTYRLRLIRSGDRERPPDGIDPALAEVPFSFKVDCPSDFDCKAVTECPPEREDTPQIDYLAKDYTRLRSVMLDRLSALVPQWAERNPADLIVTLVEMLAFRADELSYYQDAVAGEAYLGTAHKRISVRRHARLLDYPFHDGCNARTWVVFEVDAGGDGLVLPGCNPETGIGGTLLLTKIAGETAARVSAQQAETALAAASAQPFELLEDVTLREAHNAIDFYTWSDEECCLPKGATRCLLAGRAGRRLHLRKGDVLIFEEQLGRDAAEPADADRQHRHAVRLTVVDPAEGEPDRIDPVTGQAYVEVRWGAQDALPFPLCLSKRIDGTLHPQMSVARGNVALVDHGRTLSEETLGPPQLGERYRPLLQSSMLSRVTAQGHVSRPGTEKLLLADREAPAVAAFAWELTHVRPAIELRNATDDSRWTPRADLIESARFDTHFVAETEEDGRSYLRFGDDVNGRAPREGDVFEAVYRVGNGAAGNIGAEAIQHVVGPSAAGIVLVRNPLPASGGREPHPLDQAKLYAPQAFRRQERAVTLEDYARVAERHPEVQRAVATRRWTGSWHTIFLTIDRRGSATLDADLEARLRLFLERYRLAGHDLEIDGPSFVALDLAFDVCATPGYFPAHVEQRLLRLFSRDALPDGTLGFFHPDRFTFAGSVYLSDIVAHAMRVPGVDFIIPTRFQRWGRVAAGELEAGAIRLGPLEIARLDNDASAPENGRISFAVHSARETRIQ
jgi:hypothetical protein